MRKYYTLFILLLLCGSTLHAQHSVWTWGYSGYGSLGNGYYNPAGQYDQEITMPAAVSCFDDWKAVSAGRYMVLALRQNGSLWAWGSSNEMGVPTTQMEYPAPRYIQGLPLQIGTDTDWATIHTEDIISFGVKTDGSLWAWGENATGALGDGTYTTRRTPVRIGTDTDWKTVIPTGEDLYGVVGLKTDGTMWSWGRGGLLLGDGTLARRNVPTRIGTDTDWAYISEHGYEAVAAIKTDGSLWMWGENDHSELGLGMSRSGQDQSTPQRVGTDTDWKIVATTYEHTTAIKTDGSLWSWGVSASTGNLDHVPVRVGTDSDWAALSCGFIHVLALKTDGSLWFYRAEPGGAISTMPQRIGSSNHWRFISAGTMLATALGTTPFDPMPVPVDLDHDIEICAAAVTLTPSITDGGLYKWTTPIGTVIYKRTPHTYDAVVSGTYKLSVTKDGCRSDDEIEVILHSSAPLTIDVGGTAIANCPPDHYNATQPLTFRNTTPDTGTQSFTWSMGDGTTTNGKEPQYIYGEPGHYTVTLSTTTCPRAATRDIYVQPVLSVGEDVLTCLPSIPLGANVTGADSYMWTTPTGSAAGETLIADAAGDYTLTMVQYGCTQHDAVRVTFESSGAGTDFTMTTAGTPVADGANLLPGIPLTLTSTLPDKLAHTWTLTDGTTATASSLEHAFSTSGTYAITLTVGEGACSGTATKNLRVEDLIITDAISPNGDGKNDRLVITPFPYGAELKVMDRAGRTVYQAAPYNNDFSGHNLESDVYYYELRLKALGKSYKGYVHVIR